MKVIGTAFLMSEDDIMERAMEILIRTSKSHSISLPMAVGDENGNFLIRETDKTIMTFVRYVADIYLEDMKERKV